MPNNQHPSAQIVGYFPQKPGSGGAVLSLNAAATWLALSFLPAAAKTLSSVEVRCAIVNGSLSASDLSCAIYSDTNGAPGSQLAVSTTLSSPIAAGAWAIFTGFSLALSANTQYWIVLKNLNGTPATNNVSYRFGADGTGAQSQFSGQQAVAPTWGWNKAQSANSGSTWGTFARAVWGPRLDYSDGSYAGEPIQSANNSPSSVGVFGTNELGATFITPLSVAWKVSGIVMNIGKVGTPAGNVRYRLYNGTTLLGTTALIPPGNIGTTSTTGAYWIPAYFSSPILIGPGTTVRVSFGVDFGGDSGNYYFTSQATIANDANTKALFPFGTVANPGNAVKQTYFNGTSWADTDTILVPFGLLLDANGEYTPPWPRRPAGMMGGFNG